MSTGYMLNWSDNTLKPPFLLPEATVDNHTTSLQLTGKRVINWGEFLNENMMHLLEHGFSKTAPNNPTIGQLWLDANNGDLKIFTSQSTWNVIKTVPGIGTQTTTSTTSTSTSTTSTSTSTTTTPFPTSSSTTTTTPFPTSSSTTTTTPFPTSSSTTTTTTTTTTTVKPTTTTTTTTTTRPVCVDTYSSSSTGQYVKSVVKYSKGNIEEGMSYVIGSGPNLSGEINRQYRMIVGRNAEMAGMDYYYGIYQSECAHAGLPYSPNDVYLVIINDKIAPLMRASYQQYEATFGPIIYKNTYCAAKSAGII